MNEYEKVFVDFEVSFAITASVDGQQWDEFGDRSTLPFQGMVMRFFSGSDSVMALEGMLASAASLPQTARQGNLMVVLSRPKPGLVVGSFVSREDNDPFARLRWAEKLDRAICEMTRSEV